jgi:hypothetical protein
MNDKAVGTITELEPKDDGKFEAALPPQQVSVGADGKKKKEEAVPVDMANLNLIRDMLKNPESDPSEISRLITQEIQVVVADLVVMKNDPSMSETWKMKTYTEAYKALKELRQSVMDTEMLSKKDMLNFDGEKLRVYTSKLLSWFSKSMKDAGLQEDMRNSVMKHYRDIATAEEPLLRREIQQIESGLRRK